MKDQKARVLVAEDDESVRSLLALAIPRMGYRVDVCEDGDGALQRSEPGAYDVLLLDDLTGTTTGLEVLKTLRERGIPTPVILMFGRLPDEVYEACSDLTATSVLPKPFTLAALQSAIEQSLPQR